MEAINKGKKTIALVSMYQGCWRALITTLAILVFATQTARAYVVMPFFAVAFILMTPLANPEKLGRNRLILALYPCILAVGLSRIFDFESFDELPATMVEIVAGLLPILLADSEKQRRFWLAILNSCVIAIGCVTFSSSILVYAFFMFFIATLILTLNIGNLYLRDQEGIRPTSWISRDYFWQFGHVIPVGIFGATLIFLSFPRVQTFTSTLDFGKRSRTGYSGLISLADSGSIDISQELAFVTTSPDRSWLQTYGPHLFFRGDSLDTFDGKVWKTTIFEHKSRENQEDFRVATKHSQNIVSLTVLMEPHTSSAIFYPDVLVDARPQSRTMGDFLFNSNGSVIRTTYSLNRFSYLVRFMPSISETSLSKTTLDSIKLATADSLATTTLPHSLSKRDFVLYTNIPEDVLKSDWFSQWKSQLRIDASRDNIVSTAAKLSRHFQTNFRASLRNQQGAENTLQAFLTTTREGHCEYFATAAALLWRSLGIPSRVVVGYKGGDFNTVIDALEVRENHAHAWIEIYLPELGWHQFDPTPSTPSTVSESFTWFFRMYINAAAFFLREYVVDYNYQTQRNLLNLIKNASRTRYDFNFLIAYKELSSWKYIILIGSFIGLAILILRQFRHRRDPRILPNYYLYFQRRMARLGLVRQTGETFLAFHNRCIKHGIDPAVVESVDRALEAEIYADRETSPSVRNELIKSLHRL